MSGSRISIVDDQDDNRDLHGQLTERKQTEEALRIREALRESESKYRSLFEQSAEGIYLHDLEGRILDVNQAACVQSGYSKEELLGLTVFDLLPREAVPGNLPRDEILRQWHQWQAEERRRLQAHHQRKDGGVFPVEISTGVVCWGGQRLLLAIVQDITERRRIEEINASQLNELRRWQGVMLDKSDRSQALKREVNALLERLGEPRRYASVEADRTADEASRGGAASPALAVADAQRERRALLDALEDRQQAEIALAVRARQQATLAELGELVLSGVDIRVLFERTVGRLAEVLGVELCKVLELLPDRSGLLLRAGVGWLPGLVGQATVPLGLDSQAGFTLQTKEPVIVKDLRSENRFRGPPLLREHGVVSGMSTIIGVPERPFGVLGVHTTRTRTFDLHEVHLLRSVANVLAHAVQRQRHASEIDRLNRLYATISQVNQAIVRSRDRDQLCQEICRAVVEFGRFTAASIAWRADGGDELREAARFVSGGDSGLVMPGWRGGCGVLAEMWQSGSATLCNDAQTDPRADCCREQLFRLGVRSCAAFPLRQDGCVRGALRLCSIEPAFFSGEGIHLLQEVVDDISYALEKLEQEEQRERAVTALWQSENQLRVLLESSPDAIFVQTEQRFAFVNRAAVTLFGAASAADLLGQPVTERFHPDSRGMIQERIRSLNEVKTSVPTAEEVYLRMDGTAVPVEVTAVPIRYADRDGALVFARDLTERRRVQEEKDRLEDQLRQAQRLEAIGRLAGGVAHDFNNMLSVILGYGEIILSQLLPHDPLRQSVDEIVKAAQRSAQLTRQLLAFSRRQTLRPTVLDLNDVVEGLQNMLYRLIGENVEVVLRLAPGLAPVLADAGQIEQVLMNLVVNSRDAMPKGGRLTIATANVTVTADEAVRHQGVPSGDYVQLSVTDTGCGMDDKTLEHVFEPFFTTKGADKGTGLGLATVHGIVGQSRGHVRVQSRLGEGTTVRIYLPPAAGALVSEKTTKGEVSGGDGQQILLVEDERSLLRVYQQTLAGLGYRVSSAANGGEALLQVEEGGLRPDLIVTDVVMPGMSGPLLLARLRRTVPHLKAICVSGYTGDEVPRDVGGGPDDVWLQKPFSVRELAERVQEALRSERLAGRKKSILMIDDDVAFRGLVRHHAEKRGHAFAEADSTAAALEILARSSVDLLLLDLNMPGTDGRQILREVRAAGHNTPAIVLTGDMFTVDRQGLDRLGVVEVREKSADCRSLLRIIEQTGDRSEDGRGRLLSQDTKAGPS